MGWFNKSKEESKPAGSLMPELPKLPDLPPIRKDNSEFAHSKLPRMPSNSFGEKFSQNSIKQAVSREPNFHSQKSSGEKEDQMAFEADEFVAKPQKMQQSAKPSRPAGFKKTEEVEPEMDFEFDEPDFEAPKVEDTDDYQESENEFRPRAKEPVFIRIDKFEETMRVFDKTRKEILEIEKTLAHIKETREEEEKELQSWQDNILKIKDQVEKVDRDIFSKIE